MRLSEIAEYMIDHHMEESLESEVVRGNREKWYEESLIDPLMDEFWYHDLGLCGCNCPEDTKEAIRKYLHIRKDFHDKELTYEGVVRRYRTDLGIDEHSQVQHGVLQFMMYVLDKEGYTEHGGSVGGCWLTKKGEMFMDVLDAWYKREHSENQ